MNQLRIFGEFPSGLNAGDFVEGDQRSVGAATFQSAEALRQGSKEQIVQQSEGSGSLVRSGGASGLSQFDITPDKLAVLNEALVSLKDYDNGAFVPPSAGTPEQSAGRGEALLSIDVPLSPMRSGSAHQGQPWLYGAGSNAGFSNRRMAESMLLSHCAVERSGAGVGVIILDTGVSQSYVENAFGAGRFGGGFMPALFSSLGGISNVPVIGQHADPNTRVADGHGTMVARNVLSLAPQAVVYDAPILPNRIFNLESFSSHARSVLNVIETVVSGGGAGSGLPRHDHWILVNAWAAESSFADVAGPLSYSGNRAHRLNSKLIELALHDNVDVVFAAGNFGAHQPATHSGAYDRGHANAIWGANALPEVFTIGGMRSDGLAAGASSQGPGQSSMSLANEPTNFKPDFCCPSWFYEDGDASILNSGSSAATAVFAGLLASLRSTIPAMPTNDLHQLMKENAVWNAQYGWGWPSLAVTPGNQNADV